MAELVQQPVQMGAIWIWLPPSEVDLRLASNKAIHCQCVIEVNVQAIGGGVAQRLERGVAQPHQAQVKFGVVRRQQLHMSRVQRTQLHPLAQACHVDVVEGQVN